MKLEELLAIFDAAAANLAKAEAVWQRAQPLLPSSAVLGDPPGFDDLARAWMDLIKGLPPISEWTITDSLPTPNEIGRGFLDWMEVGEPPWPVYEAIEQPQKDIGEYRYRLKRARRLAVRRRIEVLAAEIDRLLPLCVLDIARDSTDRLERPETEPVRNHIAEIDRLLGDASPRTGRWSDLYRHMSFGEGHDWWDIVEFDWPSVKPEMLSAVITELDPLPVPDLDIGLAAASKPSGGVTTALRWEALADEAFERLLFDLLRGLEGYDSVEWLMKTNASDHGRDLTVHRTLPDASGYARRERVVVQAKHWRSKSVDPASILDVVSRLPAWEPPHIHSLVVATSGRFTPDAIRFIETHNEKGSDPRIEPWPEAHLEAMLARRPELTAAYGLRG
ncbi:restriction endonuclease [Mycobacteroides chelonae]